MNQTQALAKLRRVIGAKLAYRIDPKAQDAEGRTEQLALARKLSEEFNALEAAQHARRVELLKDPVYLELTAKLNAVRKERDAARWYSSHKRIAVGVDSGMFFSQRADGDNWDEVVSKVTGSPS